jgi:hypothetical protein
MSKFTMFAVLPLVAYFGLLSGFLKHVMLVRMHLHLALLLVHPVPLQITLECRLALLNNRLSMSGKPISNTAA